MSASAASESGPASVYGGITHRRITVTDLAAAKAAEEKWPMLTAYDAMVAGLLDQAGIRE